MSFYLETLSDLEKGIITELEKLRIYDCHEHLPPEKRRMNQKPDVFTLFSHYCQHDLYTAGMKKEIMAQILWQPNDIDWKWKVFKPFYEKIKDTSYSRAAHITMEKFYGESQLDDGNYREISDKIAKNNTPGLYSRVLTQACNIIASINCDGPLEDTDNGLLYQTVRTPDFICSKEDIEKKLVKSWDYAKKEIKTSDKTDESSSGNTTKLSSEKTVKESVKSGLLPEKTMKESVKSGFLPERTVKESGAAEESAGEGEGLPRCVDDVVMFCDGFARDAKRRGAVAVKFMAFYMNGADRGKAQETLDALLADGNLRLPRNNPLNEFLLFNMMKAAHRAGLVCQVHTGYWNDYRELSPANLLPFFVGEEGDRETRVDLFHCGYPNVREAIMLGKVWPNVRMNMAWTYLISQRFAYDALEEMLEMLPDNKVFGFGGDYYVIEKVFGHLCMARETIARVLAKRVTERTMTLSRALEIGRKMLYENPKEFYGFPV